MNGRGRRARCALGSSGDIGAEGSRAQTRVVSEELLLTWFVLTCFGMWTSTETLSYRVRLDAIMTAIGWICVTIYWAARHRRSRRLD